MICLIPDRTSAVQGRFVQPNLGELVHWLSALGHAQRFCPLCQHAVHEAVVFWAWCQGSFQ